MVRPTPNAVRQTFAGGSLERLGLLVCVWLYIDCAPIGVNDRQNFGNYFGGLITPSLQAGGVVGGKRFTGFTRGYYQRAPLGQGAQWMGHGACMGRPALLLELGFELLECAADDHQPLQVGLAVEALDP
jgi:hypothetical protein